MKSPKIKKDRKPFKETKFGIWLKEHDSELFEFLAARTPDKKIAGKALKALFILLARLTDEKKNEGSMLIDQD